jgi:hypothetical protein
MGWLIAAIAALFVLSKGGVASIGNVFAGGALGSSTGETNVPPQGVAVRGTANGNQGTFQAIQTANLALNAIPVVGPALSAVATALTRTFAAASAKRAQQATDENTAVAQAVPGWDSAVTQTVNAYNNGSVSAGQVAQMLAAIMSNYWSEVSPKIQPGRNGCANGASCPSSANMMSSTELATTASRTYCSGSIGAVCCVGCASLQLSIDNMLWAVKMADQTGKPSSATIQAVFPSKYGGFSRPLYTVTFQRSSSGFTL